MSHTNAAGAGVSAIVGKYDALSRSLRKQSFSDDSESASFPDLGIDAYKLLFHSNNARHLVGAKEYWCSEHGISFTGEAAEETSDAAIAQNNTFRYPLIREARTGGGLKRHSRAIILLHGLNEGSFSKYVPWACDLCRATGTPVLLFPMAFHMNRVLPAWASQQLVTAQRRSRLDGNDSAHRFNAVISDRLNHRPERFFWGAVQTYLDLIDLARQIRSGRHPHFAEAARIDVIGYSAGGYLSLFLLLDNREDLFADSRGVVFASGVPFRDLDLASPLILDLTAEVALMKLFVKNFDPPHSARMQHWIESHREGRLMRLFCGQRAQRTALEAKLREIAPRLLGITNVNDVVIPVGSMLNTLQGVKRDTGVPVREFELGVHENPFSVPSYEKETPSRKLITESIDLENYGAAFERFIGTVAEHFAV